MGNFIIPQEKKFVWGQNYPGRLWGGPKVQTKHYRQGEKTLKCWPRRLKEDTKEDIVGEVVVKKRSSVSQILRRKSFFDARRKSLFAKREKLKLEGDGEEEEDVDVRLFFLRTNAFSLNLMAPAKALNFLWREKITC